MSLPLYAESSAVLSWLLGESDAESVRSYLARAPVVIASDLTLVECDRVLIRLAERGEVTATRARELADDLERIAASWIVLRIGPEVTERARRPLPGEPLRTLDALHLALAMRARESAGELTVLSLDVRLRQAAAAAGFPVAPEASEVSEPRHRYDAAL